ncbi:MAG: hypothetical protein JNL21_41925 [Myxococcales bacterium]|nr:hypothetical protein [Myxococcales bacterium]
MRAAAAFVVAALASSLSLVPRRASADCETLRPTDPGGYFSDDFAAYEPTFVDSASGRLRVHYATSGPSAPPPTTTPPNQAPDFVVLAAEIGDEALAVYDDLGFLPIRSDAGPGACPSNGGDGRVDLYLVSFGAGDGQSVVEECAGGAASACSGYVLCEVDPAGYPSDEIALRTIVPHELFHLIQASYSGDMPSWFQEGTAQWAADRVHPALTDLEHFVPAYVEQARRSIDNPPGGAAGAFLYGTAVWPVFLDESFGLISVRGILEGLGQGMSVWEATDASLAAFGSSSADAFSRFAVALAGAGERFGTGGFIDGGKYEALPAEAVALGPGTLVSDVLSGFAIRTFEIGEAPIPHQLSLGAPPDRVAAYLLPLEAGLARVDSAVMLPATVSGPALVVVAGTSPSKQDAPFAVTASEAPPGEPDPATSTSSGAGGGTAQQDEPEEAGCSTGRSRTDGDGAWLVVVVASLMWRRKK